MQLRTATRKKVKLKIGLSAPSGAGKTYSSLLLAKGICGDWSKVVLLDSENGSGELYSHLGPYVVGDLRPPFDTKTYLSGIKAAQDAGAEVLIIDSMTHFWDWCLSYNSDLGGKYQDWAKTNKVYDQVVDAILQSPMHIITCTRRKSAYEISQEGNGKTKVTKLGTKSEMRDGFEFELSVLFSLNQNHLASAEKDRTGLFKGSPEFVMTEETGKMLREWADSGSEAPQKPQINPRIPKMVEAFGDFKVTKAHLEQHLGHPIETTTEEELAKLGDVYGELEKGAMVSKFFDIQVGAKDLNARFKAEKR